MSDNSNEPLDYECCDEHEVSYMGACGLCLTEEINEMIADPKAISLVDKDFLKAVLYFIPAPATSSDVLAKDYEGLLNAIQAGRKGTAGHSVYCDLWFSVSHIEAMRERFNQYTATSSDASELAKDIQEAIDIIERDGAMGFPRVDMYRILKRCLSALPSTERVSISRMCAWDAFTNSTEGKYREELRNALEAANE